MSIENFSSPNYSLDCLTHWRSHLRPRVHIDALAITSCPVPDLASWMYMHHAPLQTIKAYLHVPLESHSSGTLHVQSFATPGTRHEYDRRCMYM